MVTTIDLLPHIDQAVIQVISEFIGNPYQFHGDTAIMHSWYHWTRDSGRDLLFQPPYPGPARTLLLRSEHYTLLKYLDRGSKPSPGKIDYAIVRPDSIDRDGKIDAQKPVLIGIEVGISKALDDMGNMAAPVTEERVQPGDAAKLIREIRFKQMEAGYLLEFYDSREEANKAYELFEGVSKAVRASLPETDARLRIAIIVYRGPALEPMAAFHPTEWGDLIRRGVQRPLAQLVRDPEIDADTRRKSLEEFKRWCGPCNAALQDAIAALPVLAGVPRARIYDRKSMSVNIGKSKSERRKIAQIGNKSCEHGESIFNISQWLRTELQARCMPGYRITIPPERDDAFIAAVIEAMGSALVVAQEAKPRLVKTNRDE